MRAGRLDRRVTIERKTTTQDGSGAAIATWSTLATVWAEKREISGREIFAGGDQAVANVVFKIRWRSDVTNAMRITYGGNIFDIVSVKELGRREGLEITTKALVA